MFATSFLIPKTNLASILSSIRTKSIAPISRKYKEKRTNLSELKNSPQMYSGQPPTNEYFSPKTAEKIRRKKAESKKRSKLRRIRRNKSQLH